MGYAARLNPRSFDGHKSERSVRNARIERFCAFFPDREAYEAYLTRANVTDKERAYLETRLPERLRVSDLRPGDILTVGGVAVDPVTRKATGGDRQFVVQGSV